MRAMVFTAPGVVEMLDVAEPEPAAGEVVVEVALAGICGSELHGISKPGFRQPPLVMGHEFAGTLADGRRVTVNPIGHCGRCDQCSRGADNLCRERCIVGIHRSGAFAERVAVPEHLLHVLPDGMSWESAALIEPLANAVHAWRLSGGEPGARVGVIGAGTIGLVSLIVAKARGAGTVTVTDLAPSRLELARRLGADVTAASLESEYDVVIDAVGAGATRAASIDHVRPGGTAVWIGLMSADADFDAQALIRQEKTVRGTFAYTDAEFADAVAMAAQVDLGWSDVYPLEQGATIFTDLMHGRSDVVKALLSPADLTGSPTRA
jgi:threonine dehydrogenase-like Zn-dependent dehydrogenase